MKPIDKAALVAEIESLKNTYKELPTRNSYEEGLKEGRLIGYKDALHKINTLEVEGVQEGSLEKYVPLDAVLAEIERLKALLPDANDCDYLQLEFARGQQDALTDFEEFIITLEVKEVDLQKEYKEYVEEDPVYNKLVNSIVGKAIAKHFFELGLKAQKGERYERKI